MAGESIDIGRLAIPAVIALISFLSYTSQCLFWFLEPGPLTKPQAWRFNILVACIWISYYRACTVDSGRVPKDWAPKGNLESRSSQDQGKGGDDLSGRQRWCRKCSAFKPPRAHHCKICQRCIPKMDHHCPWTRNCVSHFTLPHFMRFLFYAVVSMIYLESFIFTRIGIVWEHRNMPSYLGPSVPALAHLFILLVVNSLTLFALIVLLIRSLWAIGGNVTTIESWEIERHKTLLRRAKYFGGYLDAPDGIKVLIRKQEFPYDVGILKNIRAAMGGSWNVLSWFWPLASTPDRNSGLEFEVNEFEDPGLSWPPPDPDRIPRKSRPILTSADPFTIPHYDTAAEELAAFRQRQQNDTARRQMVMNNEDPSGVIRRRRKFHERFNKRPSANQQSADDAGEESDSIGSEVDDNQLVADANDHIEVDEGEEAWRNAEGERLDDFGVDEEVEFYDEEDVPLSVLKERIKAGL